MTEHPLITALRKEIIKVQGSGYKIKEIAIGKDLMKEVLNHYLPKDLCVHIPMFLKADVVFQTTLIQEASHPRACFIELETIIVEINNKAPDNGE